MFKPLASQFCRFVSSAFSQRKPSNQLSFVQRLPFSTDRILVLNDLTYIPEAHKKRRRWGRGIGSGRGKNSGWGHQKSRSTPRAFEGGQTPLYKRLPKIGFHNHNERNFETINLYKIQEFIDMGRLVPKPNTFLTMRNLVDCGLVTQVQDGIKILAKNKGELRTPIHLEVTSASAEAIKAVEDVGGTVTAVHFNKLALRALLKPTKFDILPRRARPNPTIMAFYLDREKAGYMSPEIQLRNLQLFGQVTSEESCRKEHEQLMEMRRRIMRADKQKKRGKQ